MATIIAPDDAGTERRGLGPRGGGMEEEFGDCEDRGGEAPCRAR